MECSSFAEYKPVLAFLIIALLTLQDSFRLGPRFFFDFVPFTTFETAETLLPIRLAICEAFNFIEANALIWPFPHRSGRAHDPSLFELRLLVVEPVQSRFIVL